MKKKALNRGNLANEPSSTVKMSDKTTSKLVKQLEELKESISLYQDIIYKVGRRDQSKSEASTLPAPKSSVQAIIDVALLSKAHTTKVGIAFKPPISVDAASKTLADSAALVPALVGAFVAIHDDPEKVNKVGTLVLGEVGHRVLDFLTAQKKLFTELRSLTLSSASASTSTSTSTTVSGENETEMKEVGDRLASVGQVWKACDALVAIPTLRSAKLLEESIWQFSSMMEDVIADLEEYVENGAQEGYDELLTEWNSDEDEEDVEKQGSKDKQDKAKEAEEDNDEDEDEDEDNEKSDLQLLALKYKSDLALLLQFYQGVVLAQALKNPLDVILHQTVSGSLSAMAEKLDDLVGAFMDGEEDETSITEMYSEIKKAIKKLADLVSSAPAKSPDMEGLVDDLVKNLSL